MTTFCARTYTMLPIQGSDTLEAKFILEMTVMKGEQPDTVQMTFRRDDINAYREDDINVYYYLET